MNEISPENQSRHLIVNIPMILGLIVGSATFLYGLLVWRTMPDHLYRKSLCMLFCCTFLSGLWLGASFPSFWRKLAYGLAVLVLVWPRTLAARLKEAFSRK